jgi:phosphatidylglycerophosphate synthase
VFDRGSPCSYNDCVTTATSSSETREQRPVVILVTGRTAVARVGGISAIRRHVATASRLGLTPIVVYPPRLTALGAEIDADLDGRAACVSADAADAWLARDDVDALVIAADWFVSPAALYAFGRQTKGAAVARFVDRGRVVAPVARMPVAKLRPLFAVLSEAPVSELINDAVPADAQVVEMDPGERHRLSDSVAIERCERKLFGLGSHRAEPWGVRVFESHLAIPIASYLACTPVSPAQVSAVKILLGLVSAYVIANPGYARGLAAATIYLVSRVLDAVAADLARAAVKPKARGDKFDVTGDLIAHLCILWAIAARSGWTADQVIAAVLVTAGLLASGVMTYRRVLKPVWAADALGIRHRVRRDNFASRFSRANGPAYALLASALIGRLDLFLWAAAITSHLFYLLWHRRSTQGSHA